MCEITDSVAKIEGHAAEHALFHVLAFSDDIGLVLETSASDLSINMQSGNRQRE